MSTAGRKEMQGIAVSPGIIIGKARVVDRSRVKIMYQYLIGEDQVSREVERFRQAVDAAEEQMVALKDRIAESVKEGGVILDSHLMILHDSMLSDSTVKRILNERINAEWALKKSEEEIRRIFDRIDDEYISGRIHDVENVAERILRNLSGQEHNGLGEINDRVIIVAHELSPADTSELNTGKVMGFVTDAGGRTSHTAIIAQALEIPAVVGLESITDAVEDRDLLIVDGNTGRVIINPDDDAIIQYQEKQLQYEKYRADIARESRLPAETLDGRPVVLRGNIEFLEEVAAVREYGGEGVGLYRTEFQYLGAKERPSEEDLFEDYREVTELAAPYPVYIRTLDLGGDKFATSVECSPETNPALGLRGIRLCLREPDMFRAQLRAILRASAYGEIRIMYPMISGVQEVLDSQAHLDEVKNDLDRKGEAYDPDVKVGIIVEVPSAVAVAELLARHVDFFSLGTNDLIQYSLAIDRVNETVAHMYQPFHPAILRMIRQVVDAARAADIGVTMCGEMAGDPLCIPILLGMGFNELSVNARGIPFAKKMIRSVTMAQAETMYEAAMHMDTATEVRAYVQEQLKHLIPDLDGGTVNIEQ
ncbi:MAG: phosphoenolpyruvate--protein phosphotransferase [Deltaproteobacteria bacterium]|nr:phosphoenolpyruvate--protein phosphotransferase [Deltaproteobacteria bacterium]MBW2283148.1 phosphoenolpyruvate--protein phosphotransferase [Deltaproteobacteria bacterium]